MNKKALYESIMKLVSKEVKKALNENFSNETYTIGQLFACIAYEVDTYWFSEASDAEIKSAIESVAEAIDNNYDSIDDIDIDFIYDESEDWTIYYWDDELKENVCDIFREALVKFKQMSERQRNEICDNIYNSEIFN